jgi:hypothetical protein
MNVSDEDAASTLQLILYPVAALPCETLTPSHQATDDRVQEDFKHVNFSLLTF